MANTKAERRQREILHLLSSIPIATVAELSEALHVSLETIRKDLELLSASGEVLKVHGGVALVDIKKSTAPYAMRSSLNMDKKYRIANTACGLIKPGDSLILESSTTTLELFRALLRNPELLRTLVIITNSFPIVSLCESENSCKQLFFLGGWVNSGEHRTFSQYTSNALSRFHVEKAFLSGAALNEDFILTASNDNDLAFQKQSLVSAKTAVLLLDNSKLKKSAVQSVSPLSAFKYLVTDADFTTEEKRRIEAGGTAVLKAV